MTPDGDEITIPDRYMGVCFTDWLEIFLESSLELAKNGEIKSAYDNIASALAANVFYHSPDALLSVYICWFSKCVVCILSTYPLMKLQLVHWWSMTKKRCAALQDGLWWSTSS